MSKQATSDKTSDSKIKGIDAWNIVAPILLERMEKSTLKEFMDVYLMVYMGLKKLDEEEQSDE